MKTKKTSIWKKNVDNISDFMYKYYATTNLPANKLLSGSFFFLNYKYNRKYRNAREVFLKNLLS